MSTSDHILVVDDDTEIRTLLHEYLSRQGYSVAVASDGRSMWQALEDGHFDLLVLDLMLPGEDGMSLCRTLRSRSNLPVIMLTARGEPAERIAGLETGADDYLPKPFEPRELLARIKSVLHRTRALPETLTPGEVQEFRFGSWRLATATRQLLSPDGVVVPLSGAEYRLLCIFLQHANTVLSREQIMEMLRGRERTLPFDRSIDVQISRLRRRLRDDGHEARFIRSVRGTGYVFAQAVEADS